MSWEDLKVNWLYFWSEHKENLGACLVVLTFPIWVPFAFVLTIVTVYFFGTDNETVELDKRWCVYMGYKYPEDEVFPHLTINRWKKQLKQEEKLRKKNYIRKQIHTKEELQ